MSCPEESKIREVMRRSPAASAFVQLPDGVLPYPEVRLGEPDALLESALSLDMPFDADCRAEAEAAEVRRREAGAEREREWARVTGWRFMYLTRGERKLRELRTRVAKWIAPWLEGDEWS